MFLWPSRPLHTVLRKSLRFQGLNVLGEELQREPSKAEPGLSGPARDRRSGMAQPHSGMLCGPSPHPGSQGGYGSDSSGGAETTELRFLTEKPNRLRMLSTLRTWGNAYILRNCSRAKRLALQGNCSSQRLGSICTGRIQCKGSRTVNFHPDLQ